MHKHMANDRDLCQYNYNSRSVLSKQRLTASERPLSTRSWEGTRDKPENVCMGG